MRIDTGHGMSNRGRTTVFLVPGARKHLVATSKCNVEMSTSSSIARISAVLLTIALLVSCAASLTGFRVRKKFGVFVQKTFPLISRLNHPITINLGIP